MKYCTKCGSEMVDEAVMCTKCGCMAGKATEKKTANGEKTLEVTERKGMSTASTVISFIFDIFVIITVAMLMFSIADAWIYDYFSLQNNSLYCYFYLGEWGAICAFIASIPTVLLGIAFLIFTLLNSIRLESVFNAIKRLLIGVALVVVAIGFLINI